MTWWMLARASTSTTRRRSRPRADEPELVSGTDPRAPTITVDGIDVAGRSAAAEVTARGQRGQRGARGPGPAARAAARRSSAPAASSSRAATSARWWRRDADVKVFLTATPATRAPSARAAEPSARWRGRTLDAPPRRRRLLDRTATPARLAARATRAADDGRLDAVARHSTPDGAYADPRSGRWIRSTIGRRSRRCRVRHARPAEVRVRPARCRGCRAGPLTGRPTPTPGSSTRRQISDEHAEAARRARTGAGARGRRPAQRRASPPWSTGSSAAARRSSRTSRA